MRKKISLIVITLLLPILSYGKSQFCFSEEVSISCDLEAEENYSLNGSFSKKSNFYSFSSRRAFDGEWCQSTVKKIKKIMKKGRYCISFEEDSTNNFDLTLDSAETRGLKWSYFE